MKTCHVSKSSIVALLVLFYLNTFCQIGIGTIGKPNSSAILELQSTDKGLLFSRVSLTGTASSLPLIAHIAGMMVYNTATISDVKPGFYLNNGVQWQSITEAVEKSASLVTAVADLKNLVPIKRAIFIAGQSNTLTGRGLALLPDFSGKGLSQLGRGSVNLQVVPLTFYGTYSNTIVSDGGSFGSIFLNYYYDQLKLQYPDRDVQLLLVHCGAGASGWASSQYPNNSWRTDGNRFEDIVSRIKWVKSNGYQIDAILWLQGETDSDPNTINYKDLVKNHIQNMRDYVGNSKLPFILGEMQKDWVAGNSARQAGQAILNSIPTEVPYTAIVSSANIAAGSDQIHYTASAHLILGQRYFASLPIAIGNTAPVNYSIPPLGSYLLLDHNSTNGSYFPDIFSAIRYGAPGNALYSILGDIWKYKNADGYYHFKLETINSSNISTGIFEWKQKINPFGSPETNLEDRSGYIIIKNTLGLDVSNTTGQGFASLVYESPFTANDFHTLFHADTRSDKWWFAIGETASFNNRLPIIESNDAVNHIKFYAVIE